MIEILKTLRNFELRRITTVWLRIKIPTISIVNTYTSICIVDTMADVEHDVYDEKGCGPVAVIIDAMRAHISTAAFESVELISESAVRSVFNEFNCILRELRSIVMKKLFLLSGRYL